jgi:ribonuclease Z
MELIFLGTSSALPTKDRNHSAVALKAFGEIILLDCGEGTQRQMTRARLSPMKINKILLTHFHGDHFLGLPGLVQSMAFRGRKNPLHIFGPVGTSQIMDCIKNLGYFNLSFPIHTYELDSGLVIENEDYRVSCCPTKHTIPNLAYSIEEKRSPKFLLDKAIALGVKPGPDFGKLQAGIPINLNGETVLPEQVLGEERKGRRIVYSGDTRPCSNMINFSFRADVLIHESTFDDSHQDKALENGHSTASEASQIAKSAQVRKLILTHISTRYRDTDLLEKEALKIFENPILAEDLMRIKVKLFGN